jgi:hypothetical protein
MSVIKGYKEVDFDHVTTTIVLNKYGVFRLYDGESKTPLFIHEPKEVKIENAVQQLQEILEKYENVKRWRISICQCLNEDFATYESPQRSGFYSNSIKYRFSYNEDDSEYIADPVEKMPNISEVVKDAPAQNLNIIALLQLQQQQFQMMMQKETEHNKQMLLQMQMMYESKMDHLQEVQENEIDKLEDDQGINGVAEEKKIDFYNTIIEKVSGLALVFAEKYTNKKEPDQTPSKTESEIENLVKRWKNVDPLAVERLKATVTAAETNPEEFLNALNQTDQTDD